MKIVISNSGVSSKAFFDCVSVVEGDITRQEVGAIITVIPQNLDFKGRLNTSIAEASGTNLDEFILEHVHKPKVGDAYALPGFGLPARHILVGVMPHYRTEFDMNDSHLSGIVRSLMDLARSMLLTSVAFPAIASGRSGFPKVKAARLVSQGIVDRMHENFDDVRIVCEDAERVEIFERKLSVLGWSK